MLNTFDLIVIGAGSGGLAAAKRASSHGASVALIEGDRIGGTCVIRGCVPKKLLLYGSEFHENIKYADKYGVLLGDVSFNKSNLFKNVRNEVDRLNLIHEEALIRSGVKIFRGWAQFKTNNIVNIYEKDSKEGITLRADKVLIAVGGKPQKPDIPGAEVGMVSDDMFLLDKLPSKIVIVGAGFIACEFACIFNSLGVNVIQLVRGEYLLKNFDSELSEFLESEMRKKGIEILFNNELTSIKRHDKCLDLVTTKKVSLNSDVVLFATGREPNIEGLNLEGIGVKVASNKKIYINSDLQTSIPNIFALGDVANNYNLTPVAIEEGRVFADNVFGSKSPRNVNYDFVPMAVFSRPEIASVGLSENKAIEKYGSMRIKVYRSRFNPMSNTLSKKNAPCLLKLVIDNKTLKVLGCHMAGENASEIIQIASIAIGMKATKNDFDKTMALHPTIAEEFVTMN